MAVLALHRGVSAEKREAILVILDLLYGIVPTKNRVALRAVRAHFALVNIGVAILTILAHICEYRFYVALRALHFLVHAAQWIVRFVVIEFRDRANRPPARSGVAVLAGNGERSVRTASGLPLRCGRRSARRRRREEQQPTQNLSELSRNSPLNLSFPEFVSTGPVVVCHDHSHSRHDNVPCARSNTTVPVFSFWPGAKVSAKLVLSLLVLQCSCPAQMSQIRTVAVADSSPCINVPVSTVSSLSARNPAAGTAQRPERGTDPMDR